ncbi:MAG: 50S ribosomal protein L23 [Elusimicrobiota bacterium]|jgi:large subunit ribosomal protein L23|nr:50S ribosomal protein L23 [Elusimicrobiota bacterium]
MTKIYEIIRKPLLTEKSMILRDADNCYSFVVEKKATKNDIRSAVESIFKVHVEKIATCPIRGKVKRMGRFSGKRPDLKKALVTLKKGDKIDTVETASK